MQWQKGLKWGEPVGEDTPKENKEECFVPIILSSVKPSKCKGLICEPGFFEIAIRFFPEEEKEKIKETPVSLFF